MNQNKLSKVLITTPCTSSGSTNKDFMLPLLSLIMTLPIWWPYFQRASNSLTYQSITLLSVMEPATLQRWGECASGLIYCAYRVLLLRCLSERLGDGDEAGERVHVEEGQHIGRPHQHKADLVLQRKQHIVKTRLSAVCFTNNKGNVHGAQSGSRPAMQTTHR